MITNFELHDFKGHRDTRLTLGRFTALVGDNASGKTSVLEAIELLGENDGGAATVRAMPDLVRRGCERSRLLATGERRGVPTRNEVEITAEVAQTASRFVASGTATLYRLSARDVAGVAPVEDPSVRVDSTGANTGAVLTALKLTDDARFERIEDALRRLVPTVERVRLKQERAENQVVNRILFDFRGAANVPAHGASQGTLVLLALLTVLHGPGRPNLVLLDDFEHTLHPRAQMEVVRLIRSLVELEEFADVQVIATTHSPYVLDEMDVADVHAFAVGDDGCVRSKPLSAHPEAERSKGTLTAGQLWSLDPERAWVLKE